MSFSRNSDWIWVVNVSAGSGGRGSAARAVLAELGALLAITLADLMFGGQPVFGFVAGFEPAALGQEISEAADFVFDINGHEVGTRVVLHDARFARLVGFGI